MLVETDVVTQRYRNRGRILFLLILAPAALFLLLPARSLIAGTESNPAEWYVPDDFPDIQSALDSVNAGDVVWVRPGTYVESLDFGFKAVFLRSTAGPTLTTIDGNGSRVAYVGPGGEISGFTITGGEDYFGAGMNVEGQGTLIKGNIFDGNKQLNGGFGAAIAGFSASPIIDGNLFINNTCDEQGLSGVISFANSSAPLIINNIIENNPCRAINMSMPAGNTPQIINNTIYGNEAGVRIEGQIDNSAQIYRNNIIVGNTVGLDNRVTGVGSVPVWENNLVYNNGINYKAIPDQTGLNGNISEDPKFLAEIFSNFLLHVTSPAINSASSAGCPAADFNGAIRPQGSGCDMGAFEVVYTRISFSMDDYFVTEGETVVITVTLPTPLPVQAAIGYQTSGGTATAGIDYLPASGTLFFPPGTVIQTFTVQIHEDIFVEPDETVGLSLLNPVSSGAFVSAGVPATLTIVDDDFETYLPGVFRENPNPPQNLHP